MKIASVILSALLVFAGVALLISAQLKGNRHHAVCCFLVALAIFGDTANRRMTPSHALTA
jgi:hypothetical protein